MDLLNRNNKIESKDNWDICKWNWKITPNNIKWISWHWNGICKARVLNSGYVQNSGKLTKIDLSTYRSCSLK